MTMKKLLPAAVLALGAFADLVGSFGHVRFGQKSGVAFLAGAPATLAASA